MTQVTLYHGTTTEHAHAILTQGMKAGSHLTSREDVASYYAECAADEASDHDIDTDEVILIITVCKDALRVDYPAYEEPLTYYRNTFVDNDEDWFKGIENGIIPAPKDEFDIDTALSVTSCVKTSRAIPASMIVLKE